MAVQPKKKSTTKAKAPIKKKSTPKKTKAKSRKRKSKKKGHMKRNIFIFLSLIFMIFLVLYGYYLGKKSDSEGVQFSEIFEGESSYTTKQLLDDLSKMKKEKKQQEIHEKYKKHVQKKTKKKHKPKVVKVVKQVKSRVQASQSIKKTKQSAKKIVLVKHAKKPKLVIIIDDVSKRSQLNVIQDVGIKLTPSIFPPSELSMTSQLLAKGLKHYMIHLPMESGSKQFNTQYKTLLTSFTTRQVEKRVHELRQLFPTARYINNHTGSVYTDNYTVMHKLYSALRKEGFIFIDSRTVGSSKVRKIADEFGDAYVARDIFIDNIHEISYIHNQLRKAVKMAKKKGYAIAIGHPHKITMKALTSANEILKDVELVYIDSIYKER